MRKFSQFLQLKEDIQPPVPATDTSTAIPYSQSSDEMLAQLRDGLSHIANHSRDDQSKSEAQQLLKVVEEIGKRIGGDPNN